MEKLLNAAHDIAKALDQKFGRDILVLDISNCSVLADYFVIVTGGQPSHIQALMDTADETLHKHGLTRRAIEGVSDAQGVLMDYGDIIVHIFDAENRAYYNLERIWGDALTVSPSVTAQPTVR